MMIGCNVCENTGFVNLHQVDAKTLERFDNEGDVAVIQAWIVDNDGHDVAICPCCGDPESQCWLSETPGEHDTDMQPMFDCM